MKPTGRWSTKLIARICVDACYSTSLLGESSRSVHLFTSRRRFYASKKNEFDGIDPPVVLQRIRHVAWHRAKVTSFIQLKVCLNWLQASAGSFWFLNDYARAENKCKFAWFKSLPIVEIRWNVLEVVLYLETNDRSFDRWIRWPTKL